VTVLAASVDTLKTLEGLGAKHGFTFPLISDTSREIGAAYGVLKESASRSAERDTVVIGTDGTVKLAYERVKAEGHAAQVLADVKAGREAGWL
jgi:thioredoxin-dependent peroxiredoxin